jgi:hypothetical protein
MKLKWPPERDGASGGAPVPHKTQFATQVNSKNAIAQQLCDSVPLVCGVCKHLISRFVLMPADPIYFAAERCAQCGGILRWLPRHKPQKRWHQRSLKGRPQ